MTAAEAIGLALKIEQDAVHYYQRLKKVMPEEHRDGVQRVIDSEQGHEKKLKKMREQPKHR
jgi:rubrerythrin